MNKSSCHVPHIHSFTASGHRDTTSSSSSTDLCAECATRVSQIKNIPLDSPVHHLLSNTKRHIPSAEEEVQVRAFILDAEQRTAAIDVTRARLTLLLEELALERLRIQEYADQHRVMVAPVWELPPEILSCIFIMALPRRPRYPQELTRSSIKSSLLLASVNQHWRYVALSTPQLWTAVYIDEQSFTEGSINESVCIPKVFLSRSGDLPLSLYVRAKEYPCSRAFITLVSSLSPRWRGITLEVEVGNLAPLVSPLDAPPDSLRALQILDLRIPSLWLEGAEVNPFTYFANAPALEQVSLTNPFSASFRILPWRQLKVWDSPVPLSDFPLVFDWAPNLEHCFLQPMRLAMGQMISPPEAVNSAVARNLTSLHISTGLIANISVQLHHLPHFPALRFLFIYLDKRVQLPEADTTLVPLFARSGALLEQLTLAVNVSLNTLRACLAHTPEVTTLHIHRIASDVTLGFLSQAPSPTAAYLLPKLTKLRLSGKIYFSARAVINVINARWTDPSAVETGGMSPSSSGESDVETQIPTVPGYPRSLKSVHILPPRHDKFDSRTRKELLSFKDKGFDVQISQFDRVKFIRHVVRRTVSTSEWL